MNWQGRVTAHLFSAWALVLATACGPGGTSPASTSDGTTAPLVLRPGDTLLDHLAAARLSDHPDTLLPAALAAAARGPLVERLVTLPAEGWHVTPVQLLPPALAALAEEDPPRHLWYIVPPLVPLDAEAGGASTGFLHEGRRVPTRRTLDLSVGELPVFWYPRRHSLAALAAAPPGLVELREDVPSSVEFDLVERGAVRLGRDPEPGDLRGRFELGQEVLPALLLPPPASLTWNVDAWRADELQLAVGLVDLGWFPVDGAVQRRRSRSDGVELSLEVDGERLWSRRLEPEEAGRWVHASVDLSAWRGRGFQLRLRTEAGPAGHDLSDYVAWGGLRAAGAPERTPGRPHVVLIDVDTLRADRLAAYGPRERTTTPGLDAWVAEHGVTYTDAVSTAPWTLPATVSMLTGRAVHQHGIDAEGEALDAGAATLAARLRAAGYETLAFTGGAFLDPDHGWDAGFDRYVSRDPRAIAWEEALERLAEPDSERPLFVFLHTYRVHQPYPFDPRFVDPAYEGPLAGRGVDRGSVFLPVKNGTLELSPQDVAYVEALYDALVLRMDRAVSAFLDALERRVDHELLVVFTSDHGEAFLEHGVIGHGQALHGELLRVPLVIRYPSGEQPAGGARLDDRPASLLDILPTVLDVVGLPADPSSPGTSLRAPLGSEQVRLAEHDEQHAVHSGGWKLLEGGEVTRLFAPDEDPVERHDLAGERPGVVDELRRRREWFLQAYPADGAGVARRILPGAEEIEQLQALGYLGDG